jgi:hypothetical protein
MRKLVDEDGLVFPLDVMKHDQREYGPGVAE